MSTFITRSRTRNPLLMPELLQCILDCFPPDVLALDLERNRTLVALAQTCQAISEPTLDRIWRKSDSLFQLIRCVRQIPFPFLFGEHNEQDLDPEYMVPQTPVFLDEVDEMIPLAPSEWAVVGRYSHRVWELTIDNDNYSLMFLKSAASQRSPLFPNLKVISWSFSNPPLPGAIELFHPLLSPTLLELRAGLTIDDGEALQSFLRIYPVQCPNLKTVTLRFPGHEVVSDATIYALSRAVCTHEKLTHLAVGLVDAAALRHLATSSKLEVLSLEHHPQTPVPKLHFRPEDMPFQHVTKLNLTTLNLDFVASLLRPHDQILQILRLHIHGDRTTAEALSTFLSMLESPSFTNSIRHLEFKFRRHIRSNAEPPTEAELELFRLPYQSLVPLMSFCHLRELVIDWGHQITLDDNELEKMARCWPLLQCLSLKCSRGIFPPQWTRYYLTFNGLLKLALVCPDLRDVRLPLDAREIPTDVDPDARQTAIENLSFPESPISEARPVAEFLLRHFPSVHTVSGHMHTWVKVDMHIGNLRGRHILA